MKMVSPGDARVSVDEAAAYALATHRHALRRLEHISEEYGEELAAFSSPTADVVSLDVLSMSESALQQEVLALRQQKELAPVIFSRDPAIASLGEVAWESFVVNTRPDPDVFEVLREQYREAIDLLSSEPRSGPRFGDPEKRLAEHLVELYWQGHVGLGGSDSLVTTFYDKAPSPLPKRVMEFVGRQLRSTKGKIPPDILQRLEALWEYRFMAAHDSDDPRVVS